MLQWFIVEWRVAAGSRRQSEIEQCSVLWCVVGQWLHDTCAGAAKKTHTNSCDMLSMLFSVRRWLVYQSMSAFLQFLSQLIDCLLCSFFALVNYMPYLILVFISYCVALFFFRIWLFYRKKLSSISMLFICYWLVNIFLVVAVQIYRMGQKNWTVFEIW